TRLNRYHQFVQDSRKAGLLINGTYLVGTPGETKETMRKTLDLAKSLNTDLAQFYPVMVYPGTELYDLYKAQGFIITDNYRDWVTEDGLHNCVVNLPGVSGKEMVEFCDTCRREFYLRPKYVFYKAIQGILNPREGLRTVKAAKIFAKPLLLGTRLDRS
ncbi:MAG: B12-binding domain-containing radical SAM protein, partial [Anaerolinea sp.]|nr:B12-binding domain-containing radical SAM protein [Anaerolinea sp.]